MHFLTTDDTTPFRLCMSTWKLIGVDSDHCWRPSWCHWLSVQVLDQTTGTPDMKILAPLVVGEDAADIAESCCQFVSEVTLIIHIKG